MHQTGFSARRAGVAAAFIALAALAAIGTSCTTYRIIRYRDPDARNMRMFGSRAVHRADTELPFAVAPRLRDDLDTVTVRAPGGTKVPFASYLANQKVLAFLVVQNDTIVYERYRDGYSAATVHSSFSMAKSVLSALVGIAVGEGAIRSLDDKVTDYVSELASNKAFDGVTIRNLLEMKSGLRYTLTGRGFWNDVRSDKARSYYTRDLHAFIRHAERDTPPGTHWEYKDTDAETLGWVLARATGKSVSQYTEEKLWRLIGTEHDASWSLDRDGGEEKVASGFNATTRDFARLGRLFLNGGVANGAQVVPASWVAASVAVDTTRTEPEISNWWKMQHTMYWWHPIQPPAGEFYADGAKGQRIYVDPRTRTIIVQLANESNQDFPFRKIVAYLNGRDWQYPVSIPATLRQIALSGNIDSLRVANEQLTREEREHPDQWIITEHAMNSIADDLVSKPATLAAGIEFSRIVAARYPRSVAALSRLRAAYVKNGDAVRADSIAQQLKERSAGR